LIEAALNGTLDVPQGCSEVVTYPVTASVFIVGEGRTVPQKAGKIPAFIFGGKMNNDVKIAVLIDAENISYKYIKLLLDELSKYGTPTYKRIYGDWTNPILNGWKNVLLEHSIQPIQQYSYTTGKSSSDSAMIIDAMDILYSGKVDGFCLVSSDSDFTKLAQRLREAGKLVIGMGEKKTPEPFIKACERFIYLEVLSTDSIQDTRQEEKLDTPIVSSAIPIKELADIITNIINDVSGDDGWAYLSAVGNSLLRRDPSFDTRTYGFSKLKDLVMSIKILEEKTISTEKGAVSYVRKKPLEVTQLSKTKSQNSTQKKKNNPSTNKSVKK